MPAYTFYAAIDPDTADAKFCVLLDGNIIARCDDESWSCAIRNALNMLDYFAKQSNEVSAWPK